MKVTRNSDYVCMPQVVRRGAKANWFSNRVLAISPDNDNTIAYLSWRNETSNIFIKDLTRQGSSTQRTNRNRVLDFSYSPDGKYICFAEQRGQTTQIFQTDAKAGYVCGQITSGNNDFSPVYSQDMSEIFFARSESMGASIWSYKVVNKLLSSISLGMNPCLIPGQSEMVCARSGNDGRYEIWKINMTTGSEECLVSDPTRSFTSPQVSPDGKWMVFVGDSQLGTGNSVYVNVDVFACRIDGTGFTQLTYHAADDLSPVWSCDGRYIYFVSQRGDMNGTANIWRMNFLLNR
ncbi:MAG: hypothetical protein Q4E59_01520 [Bacteroidales bacterium]|nr:hypothetical protein [Bacteroidales bacterium]